METRANLVLLASTTRAERRVRVDVRTYVRYCRMAGLSVDSVGEVSSDAQALAPRIDPRNAETQPEPELEYSERL